MQRALMMKWLVVVGIALGLLVPLSMIENRIDERASYRQQAQSSIAQSWTGPQQLIGPLVQIRYRERVEQPIYDDQQIIGHNTVVYDRERVLLAGDVHLDGTLKTEKRYKGIYAVPVYISDMTLNISLGDKLAEAIAALKQRDNVASIDQVVLSLGISDSRGIAELPSLIWQSQSLSFQPGSSLSFHERGLHAELPASMWSEASLDNLQVALRLRGITSLTVTPTADTVGVTLSSSWPHPAFVGDFLPEYRQVDDDGFEAVWKINAYASDIQNRVSPCVDTAQCDALQAWQFGVDLLEPVDVYAKAKRSIKYGILFVCLSFVAFLIFEVIKSLPIHPVQYTLVGLALAVFYLLLISLSEHISFGWAYLLASMACIGLLAVYLIGVLKNRQQVVGFTISLMVLYIALYIIVGAEDFAMLMGASLTFAVLAITMLATRGIDWYQVALPSGQSVKLSEGRRKNSEEIVSS